MENAEEIRSLLGKSSNKDVGLICGKNNYFVLKNLHEVRSVRLLTSKTSKQLPNTEFFHSYIRKPVTYSIGEATLQGCDDRIETIKPNQYIIVFMKTFLPPFYV